NSALYSLSLHDALPICLYDAAETGRASPLGSAGSRAPSGGVPARRLAGQGRPLRRLGTGGLMPLLEIRNLKKSFGGVQAIGGVRSEEHTSELQSRENLV